MNKSFQSVADVCGHINTLPDMEAKITHELKSSGNAGVAKVSFVSVAFRQHSFMWRFETAQRDNENVEITVGRTLEQRSFDAGTPSQLTSAIATLVSDFKL